MSFLDAHAGTDRTSAPTPSQLVELVYDGATEPSLWPAWFSELATSIGHRASTVVVRGFGPTRYVSLDDPAPGFDRLNPSCAFERRALSKQSFEMAYVDGEIVEDWTQIQPDRAPTSGIQIYSDDERSLLPRDRTLLRAVLPHFHRAAALHFRLEASRQEQDALRACVDELAIGMMILDEKTRVSYANRAALDHLDDKSGLVPENGKLTARDADVSVLFQRNLAAVTSGRARTMRSQRLPGGATIWLRPTGSGRAIAFIMRERNGRGLLPKLLADAFDLSPAEARVGARFLSGRSVDAIACDTNLSVHTVRLHLKKIQSKTDTNRQATLMRRMLETLPPVHL